MARQEADREDLLREATALRERIEYRTGSGETIVVGFRSDSSCSLFFGMDPVYQFNRQGELRRAFVDGCLVKAETGRLVVLKRQRLDLEVQLIRQPTSSEATERLMDEARRRLSGWLEQLRSGDYDVVGKVPSEGPVEYRVQQWLEELLRHPMVIARTARLHRGPGPAQQ